MPHNDDWKPEPSEEFAKRETEAMNKEKAEMAKASDRPGLKTELPDHILQFFEYDHLKAPLCEVSKVFHTLAHEMVRELPRNPERTVALRKLLEAKDAAVRAALAK